MALFIFFMKLKLTAHMTKVQSGILTHIDWQIEVVQVINIFFYSIHTYIHKYIYIYISLLEKFPRLIWENFVWNIIPQTYLTRAFLNCQLSYSILRVPIITLCYCSDDHKIWHRCQAWCIPHNGNIKFVMSLRLRIYDVMTCILADEQV